MALPPDPPESKEPGGHTTFCEDIRTEADGRNSLIGVFNSDVGLPEFPALLPKFGLSILYHQPRDLPPTPLALKVIYVPEGSDEEPRVLIDAEIDLAEGLRQIPDDMPYVAAAAQIVMSPLQLATPGTLKVRGYREGATPVRLGSVHFKRAADIRPGLGSVTRAFAAGEQIKV